MSTEKKATLLFVDDEKNILSAIRRALRREPYRLLFANNGAHGLEILKENSVDMVVSDILMPVMDGMKFLREVKEKYPDTIRLILTGYADRAFVQEALSKEYAHEVIAKPWEEERLKEIIQNALDQSETQTKEAPWLRTIINSVSGLPTLPQAYLEIREILSEEDVSIEKLSDSINRSPSISTRILRWANSSIFGQKAEVDTVNRAVLVLGLDMVGGLALSQSVMDSLACEEPELSLFNRSQFWLHANACGATSKLLIERVTRERRVSANALTAGLLHDLGKLVSDLYLREPFARALQEAADRESILYEAEKEAIGATHAEIGHYLSEWWNLPQYLSDVIWWHHTPSTAERNEDLVAAVHVADVLVQGFSIGRSGNAALPELDEDAFSRFGIEEDDLDGMKDTVEAALA